MITTETINKYLKANGKTIDVGFLVKDSGSGNFIKSWSVTGLSKPAAADLTQYVDSVNDDRKAEKEREWRDGELVGTDTWGLTDRTMTAEMTTYRQELRDIPDLTGFPNTHTRPTLK